MSFSCVGGQDVFTLAPYICVLLHSFQVSRGLSNFPLLFALMRVVNSLLQNPHIHIEPYVSSPSVDIAYFYISFCHSMIFLYLGLH